MISAPGRQIPRIAAIAPRGPRRRSPARIAIFVPLRPGSASLIDNIWTKVGSSNQPRFATRLRRKYATRPPPTLVAPIIRNAVNIWQSVRRSGAAASSACGVPRPLREDLLMSSRRIAFEPIDHCRLGRPERDPIRCNFLKGDVKLLAAFHGLLRQVVPTLELKLEREFPHERLVLTARTPERDIGIG